MSEVAEFRPELEQEEPSVADVLSAVVERLDAIDEQTRVDITNYEELTYERAELIRDFPNMLTFYEDQGIEVPCGVRWHANTWSNQAERVILDDNLFGMSTLLVMKGTESNDPEPTAVHKLLAQLQDGNSGEY